jgi:hypothetical protein
VDVTWGQVFGVLLVLAAITMVAATLYGIEAGRRDAVERAAQQKECAWGSLQHPKQQLEDCR